MTRRLTWGLVFAGLVVITACGDSSPSASSAPAAGVAGVQLGTPTLGIVAEDHAFTPPNPTVHVGDIIQWTVPGRSLHTVTFVSQTTLSDVSLVPGGSWEVKFTTPGTYAYICAIHAEMTGSIIVH